MLELWLNNKLSQLIITLGLRHFHSFIRYDNMNVMHDSLTVESRRLKIIQTPRGIIQ